VDQRANLRGLRLACIDHLAVADEACGPSRRISSQPLVIYRFDAGKIVESWIQVDRLAALAQMRFGTRRHGERQVYQFLMTK